MLGADDAAMARFREKSLVMPGHARDQDPTRLKRWRGVMMISFSSISSISSNGMVLPWQQAITSLNLAHESHEAIYIHIPYPISMPSPHATRSTQHAARVSSPIT